MHEIPGRSEWPSARLSVEVSFRYLLPVSPTWHTSIKVVDNTSSQVAIDSRWMIKLFTTGMTQHDTSQTESDRLETHHNNWERYMISGTASNV